MELLRRFGLTVTAAITLLAATEGCGDEEPTALEQCQAECDDTCRDECEGEAGWCNTALAEELGMIFCECVGDPPYGCN